MDRKLKLKRGWFGDTVSYVYLTILAIISPLPFTEVRRIQTMGNMAMMARMVR